MNYSFKNIDCDFNFVTQTNVMGINFFNVRDISYSLIKQNNKPVEDKAKTFKTIGGHCKRFACT